MSNTDSSTHRFAIALSFPGERREYVEQVAKALLPAFGGEEGKARIFYDDWHESSIIGYGSNRKLEHIYATDSDLIVPFYCQDYRQKKWCGVELRAIEQLLFDQEFQRVLPFRFDQVEIPGSFKQDIFPDVSKRPVGDIARLILDRYRELQLVALGTGGRSAATNIPPFIGAAGSSSDRTTKPHDNLPTPQPEVVAIWAERLAFLQVEEAKAVTAMEKFQLFKEIERARAKIREYGGRA